MLLRRRSKCYKSERCAGREPASIVPGSIGFQPVSCTIERGFETRHVLPRRIRVLRSGRSVQAGSLCYTVSAWELRDLASQIVA
jgi:hypothetical protein